MNEQELVTALSQGSHEAFQKLYEQYQTRIFYFIYGITRSRADTEELFQSVFLKIWENRSSLNPDLSFSGYIYQTARNNVYNHLQSKLYDRKLEAQLSKKAAMDDYGNAEPSFVANDLQAYINGLVERLPERRREIFRLHYRHYKTYKEISQLLHISENTVDTQIRRALNFLRTEVSKEFIFAATMLLPSMLMWLVQ